MSVFTLTIPHQLGRKEAKERITANLNRTHQKLEKYVDRINYEWQNYRVSFTVEALAQTATGSALVEESCVIIEVELPTMLRMLAKSLQPKIEREATRLLC